LIINGEIKLRSRVGFKEITEHGVILSDDSFIPADVIIYATGYGMYMYIYIYVYIYIYLYHM
jgi:putative flavoprotein involved in K+ transport